MPDSSNAERTPDGHYLIIDGRRWRASDPGIPDTLRQELVDELMSARRAVRTQGAAARTRVDDAKVALGERGRAWWEQPTEQEAADRITDTKIGRASCRERVCQSVEISVVAAPVT